MTSPLTLVGTIHIDPQGPERLEALLSDYQPKGIGVELCPLRASRTQKPDPEQLAACIIDDPRLLFTPEERQGLTTYLSTTLAQYGFEHRIPDSYTQAHPNTGLFLIDKELDPDRLNAFLLSIVRMSITGTEFKKLIADPYQLTLKVNEMVSSKYAHPEQLLADEQRSQRFFNDPDYKELTTLMVGEENYLTGQALFDPDRDLVMARNIRNAYDGKGPFVAVMGLAHAFPVKELLKDLDPQIIPLGLYAGKNSY